MFTVQEIVTDLFTTENLLVHMIPRGIYLPPVCGAQFAATSQRVIELRAEMAGSYTCHSYVRSTLCLAVTYWRRSARSVIGGER